jgi:hypothetical protein
MFGVRARLLEYALDVWGQLNQSLTAEGQVAYSTRLVRRALRRTVTLTVFQQPLHLREGAGLGAVEPVFLQRVADEAGEVCARRVRRQAVAGDVS